MKFILFILVFLSSSCKSNKPMTNKTAHKIITQLELEKNTFKVGEPISVNFSVQNKTTTAFEFCYWQTPLEKEFTAHFFEIIYQGKVLPYIGRMVKRNPPTKEDHRILKPEETSTQTININVGYNLSKPGVYTIRFLGRSINGLPDSEPINFSIHKKSISRHEAIVLAKNNAKLFLRSQNSPRHFIVDAKNGNVLRMNIEYSENPKKMILDEYIAMYGRDKKKSEISVWEIILKYKWAENSTEMEVEKVRFLTITP